MKLRRIDINHEEFLAGVSGEMTPAELGVYWMICLLQYNRGGSSIKYDLDWLRGKFKHSHGNCAIKGIVDKLIASGKVERDGNEISVRRCREETERRQSVVREATENGKRGGRPRKHINGLAQGSGFHAEKLTTTNSKKEEREDGILSESLQSESESSKTAQTPSRYAYAGKVVRLVSADYELWRSRFYGIPDFDARLGVMDDFYAAQPADEQAKIRKNWFVRLERALEKDHQLAVAVRAERRAQSGNGGYRPMPSAAGG